MINYMKRIVLVVNVHMLKIKFNSYFLPQTVSFEETFFNSHRFLKKVKEVEKKSKAFNKNTNDDSIQNVRPNNMAINKS